MTEDHLSRLVDGAWDKVVGAVNSILTDRPIRQVLDVQNLTAAARNVQLVTTPIQTVDQFSPPENTTKVTFPAPASLVETTHTLDLTADDLSTLAWGLPTKHDEIVAWAKNAVQTEEGDVVAAVTDYLTRCPTSLVLCARGWPAVLGQARQMLDQRRMYVLCDNALTDPPAALTQELGGTVVIPLPKVNFGNDRHAVVLPGDPLIRLYEAFDLELGWERAGRDVTLRLVRRGLLCIPDGYKVVVVKRCSGE